MIQLFANLKNDTFFKKKIVSNIPVLYESKKIMA